MIMHNSLIYLGKCLTLFSSREYFRRSILCNSLVWSCEYTGRSNLTLSEALQSEADAAEHLRKMPVVIQQAICFIIHKNEVCFLLHVGIFIIKNGSVDQKAVTKPRFTVHCFLFDLRGKMIPLQSALKLLTPIAVYQFETYNTFKQLETKEYPVITIILGTHA